MARKINPRDLSYYALTHLRGGAADKPENTVGEGNRVKA